MDQAPAPPTRLTGFERLLDRLLSNAIRFGQLSVRYPGGVERIYGEGEPAVTVRLADAGAVRAIYLDPALAFAEMYMDGRMIIEAGGLDGFNALAKRNGAKRFASAPAIAINTGRIAHRLLRRYVFREQAQRNVAHHYDLDERLFRLFLDEDLQYSCAYFAEPGMSLEAAQRAKKRHIAAKMMLEPGQRVLDIGCGFGGMALYLAEHTGVEVVGITLSKEQHAVATRRAQERGLADRVRFELRDYREIEGPFERIVSVGMFEHVGPQNFRQYFKSAARLMTDDGLFLLHSIGRGRPNLFDPPFIEKYIFPNGHIPALSEAIKPIEQSRLLIKDVEILTYHYAHTLAEWRRRFQANRAAVLDLYDERFFRMWDLYLATSEMSFRHGSLVNFQIQITKQQATSRPTREYIAEAEMALASRDGLHKVMNTTLT